ncbi:hypothetical protein ECANGB1_2667 [Enterospora canceri]|uniref:Uncharacterized protein n=1 Tax=Enterospora canceri TaxID=1081671 RepID=A0A1Y1S595_9MICR|nr:hypothetical protein ECANGB1_2667 [Enterospora canceri]
MSSTILVKMWYGLVTSTACAAFLKHPVSWWPSRKRSFSMKETILFRDENCSVTGCWKKAA